MFKLPFLDIGFTRLLFSRVDKVGSKSFCLIFFAVAVVGWVLGALPFSLISGRYSVASHFVCISIIKIVFGSSLNTAFGYAAQHVVALTNPLTRDWTCTPCSGSTWPLDCHKSPVLLLIDHLSLFACFYIKEMFCLSSFMFYVQYLCECMHFIMWLAVCSFLLLHPTLCLGRLLFVLFCLVLVVCFCMLIFV